MSACAAGIHSEAKKCRSGHSEVSDSSHGLLILLMSPFRTVCRVLKSATGVSAVFKMAV